MKKFTILFSILFFVFLQGIQNRLIAQEHKRIVVLGSSSAFGYFGNPPLFPHDSAWAYRVKDHYKKSGIIDTLYNLGVSGTNPYAAMPSSYIPPSNRPQPDPQHNITKALSYNPDVIIVNFPSNQYDWMPFEEVINCLQTIKDSAEARGVRCFITTTQPRNGFSFSERQRLKELKEIIMATFGVFAINFFTPVVQEPELIIRPEYNLGDGVHLNAAGHSVLFNQVLEADVFYIIVPVKFGEVYAKRMDADALVNWQVYFESDVDKYVVESSRDGINYNYEGSVSSIGNTTQSRVYNFIDKGVDQNIHHYRVVAYNTLGKSSYSDGVHLSAGLIYDGRDMVYPTVAIAELFLIYYSGSHNVITYITGSDGKRYYTEMVRLEPSMVKRVNVQRLRPGSYYYTVDQAGNKRTWKFLKQ